MYHGIIIDQEFTDKSFPNKFKIFAKKQDGDWEIYGIEIEDNQVKEVISQIQKNMKSNESWYAHFYNNEKLIVVFKNRIIEVETNKRSWEPVIKYGKELNIPEEQLDFCPSNFKDEKFYFS
jgi:hypothetical protein